MTVSLPEAVFLSDVIGVCEQSHGIRDRAASC